MDLLQCPTWEYLVAKCKANFSPFHTDNSKNPLLLFGTRVVEWSDTVKVPFSDAEKKFFEFLYIVQLPITFFGSWLVQLINYAIGPSTLKELHHPFKVKILSRQLLCSGSYL